MTLRDAPKSEQGILHDERVKIPTILQAVHLGLRTLALKTAVPVTETSCCDAGSATPDTD